MTKTLKIKTANRAEIDIAVDWAANEGWNPGLFDADCYHKADPEGFLIGYVGDEPVATISAVKYGHSFGFIGFYIVAEAWRGKSYGIQLWNSAMKRLAGRNIGLDGVLDQQENYQKSGFKLVYSNIRYEGATGAAFSPNDQVVALSTLSFDSINAYDHPFFPDTRSTLMQAWINQPESIALGFIEEGRLAGYGVIRRCRSGYKIGPLFADTADIAEVLFMSLQAQAKKQEPLFLDVPEVNMGAVELAGRHNMQPVFETAKMYTSEIPKLPLSRIFGVTSFEVG